MAIDTLQSPRIDSPFGDSIGTFTLYNKALYIFQRRDTNYTAAVLNVNDNLDLTVDDTERFSGDGSIGSLAYVSGLDGYYPIVSVTDSIVTINTNVVPSSQTGFVNNNGLKHYITVQFVNTLTSVDISTGKFLTSPNGQVRLDANPYIVKLRGQEHTFPIDTDNSIIYQLVVYEYINGAWDGHAYGQPAVTAVEGKVQLAVNSNLWEYCWTLNHNGSFLNTSGSEYFGGITSVEYVYDFLNLPNIVFNSLSMAVFDRGGVEHQTVQQTFTASDAGSLTRIILNPVTTYPGGYILVAINAELPPAGWNAIRLDTPDCQISDNESVIARWINNLGAYNYLQFKSYSRSQSVESRVTIPVYNDGVYEQVSQGIYSTEQSYTDVAFDSISVQYKTDNIELMSSLINTGTLEVLQGGFWVGHIVQDGSIPIAAKNRSNFTYNFEFRKLRI